MDSIVQSIVTALSGKISKELIVFLVSMVPLLELRGSILAAGPVSYTHLDVYKRQRLRCASSVPIKAINSVIAFFIYFIQKALTVQQVLDIALSPHSL